MNKRLILLLLAAALGGSLTLNASDKPRIIVTTDLGADPDDEQSMVRLLVCANEFDIEGLIVSTGCWRKNQSNTDMLDKIVDAYAKVLPNLQVHAKGFPSYEYLKSISVMGQTGYGMSDVGDGKDSMGSELIIASVDKDDPRPVWVQFWGGGNNLAQSIKRWNKGYDNDFAARMDWSITSNHADANHHPLAVVNGDASRKVLEVSAAPGSSLKLDASGSSDPDKNALNYAWSFYKEPSSYDGDVKIQNDSSSTPTVSIPSDASGQNIHVILELYDDGTPSLYADRRVIIDVR